MNLSPLLSSKIQVWRFNARRCDIQWIIPKKSGFNLHQSRHCAYITSSVKTRFFIKISLKKNEHICHIEWRFLKAVSLQREDNPTSLEGCDQTSNTELEITNKSVGNTSEKRNKGHQRPVKKCIHLWNFTIIMLQEKKSF